jgi:folylpolyglutamate synthase/dihydropteroate synthase
VEDAESVESAIGRAREVTGPGDVIVVTGSIYIVGEAMRILGLRI